ncbi:MAG: NAD(P)/FAD-dependent oxidoreductase [Dongiaceae bacterium]
MTKKLLPYLGKIDRRAFLAGLAATAAFPAWAQAAPSNPDVVIVGAGAAGLAAARILAERGVSFVILESKGRVGGRAFTDTSSFGVPFDHGAAWIHQADHNPLTPMAHRNGYTLVAHDDNGEQLFVDTRAASPTERAAYDEAWYEVTSILRGIGHSGQDVSAASQLPVNLPWTNVVKNWIGPLDLGCDIESFSAADWWSLDYSTPSLMVREGYGRFIAGMADGVPVQTSTPVTTIRWGGANGVTVETPSGNIQAKAVIVTVSTGVLAAESIRFDPPLPTEKQRAIEDLPMGLVAKIALEFDGSSRFGLRENDWLSYTRDSNEVAYFLSWPFGDNLMIGTVGGKFAWDLTRAGEAAAIDFALGELRRLFGPEVDQHFVRGVFTGWGSDQDVRGAFAIARPGGCAAREQLAQPVENRLFFAGEALGGGMATTAGGAFVNGRQVAASVARLVT